MIRLTQISSITSPYKRVSLPTVSLSRFLLQTAERHHPHKAAYIDGHNGQVVSFSKFLESVWELRKVLHHKYGVSQGDTVAIYGPNNIDYPVYFHAASSLGATITCGNPKSTTAEIARHLQDSESKFVIIHPALISQLPPEVKEMIPLQPFEETLRQGVVSAADPPRVEINPIEDVALLPYSSGTTGLPKGVQLTHYNMVSNIVQTDKNIINTDLAVPDLVNLALIPFHHIYGTMLLNHTLFSGQTSVISSSFYLKSILQTLQDYEVDYAAISPPVLKAIACQPELLKNYKLRLRDIGSGGANLDEALAKTVEKQLTCRIRQGFGMTEASPALIQPSGTSHPDFLLFPQKRIVFIGAHPVKHSSVGFPIPSTELQILDEKDQICENGTWGRMFVRGPQIMRGYKNNPTATQEVLGPDRWLKTGDIAYVDDAGYVFIVDREKDMIRYKGTVQISPSELESIFLKHPAVNEACVVPGYNKRNEEVPKAFIVLKDPKGKTPIDPSALLRYYNNEVPAYKQISQIEILEALPRNTNGKVLRNVLVQNEKKKAGL